MTFESQGAFTASPLPVSLHQLSNPEQQFIGVDLTSTTLGWQFHPLSTQNKDQEGSFKDYTHTEKEMQAFFPNRLKNSTGGAQGFTWLGG